MANEQEEILEEDIEEDYGERLQYLNVIIEGESFGLDIMKVQEILEIPVITPVPNTPETVLGVCNIRGKIVTVVDVRKLFEVILQETPSQYTHEGRAIVVNTEKFTVCILVNSVVDVLSIPEKTVGLSNEVMGERVGEYIEGIYRDKDQNVVTLLKLDELLDPQKVVHAGEIGL